MEFETKEISIKRFLVFCSKEYNSEGAFYDFKTSFNNKNELEDFINLTRNENEQQVSCINIKVDYIDVIDIQTGEMLHHDVSQYKKTQWA